MKRHRPTAHSSAGFTLTEMLVTIAVTALLGSLLVPQAQQMFRRSKQAQCMSNLRAIAVGFQNFLAENNQRYPGNGEGSNKYLRWICRIGPYMDLKGPVSQRAATNGEKVDTLDNAFNQSVFHCPVTKKSTYLTSDTSLESLGIYGAQNKIIATEVPPGDPITPPSGPWGISALSVRYPARTVLIADRYAGGGTGVPSAMGANLATSAAYPSVKAGVSANHRMDGNPAADAMGAGPANFLFCDGHVETIDLIKLRPFIDKAGASPSITFNP